METETWALVFAGIGAATGIAGMVTGGFSLWLQHRRPVQERQRELLGRLEEDIVEVQQLVSQAVSTVDGAPDVSPWDVLDADDSWRNSIGTLTAWAGENPAAHLTGGNRSLLDDIGALRRVLNRWEDDASALLYAAKKLEEVRILGSNVDLYQALDEHRRAKETFVQRSQGLQPRLDVLEWDVRRRRDTRP